MIKAVLLIGGPSRGTRFRPLSLYNAEEGGDGGGGTIKPLFPIAGQAMIGHHLLALSKLSQDATKVLEEVLIIGFYESNQLEGYLEHARITFGLSIQYCIPVLPIGSLLMIHLPF